MEFLIHKRNGVFTNTGKMKAYNESLADGSYLVKIDNSKKRSNDQNSYYWGIVVPLVFKGLKDAGFDEVKTVEDAHLIMKSLFLKKFIPGKDGEGMEIVRSTTDLKTIEFSEFLLSVWQWAAEYLGVQIPEPNEQLEFEL
jgi:hypothetical protein